MWDKSKLIRSKFENYVASLRWWSLIILIGTSHIHSCAQSTSPNITSWFSIHSWVVNIWTQWQRAVCLFLDLLGSWWFEALSSLDDIRLTSTQYFWACFVSFFVNFVFAYSFCSKGDLFLIHFVLRECLIWSN